MASRPPLPPSGRRWELRAPSDPLRAAARAAERLSRILDRGELLTALAEALREQGCESAVFFLDERGLLQPGYLSHPPWTTARATRALGLAGLDELRATWAGSEPAPFIARLLASKEPVLEAPPQAIIRALVGRKATAKRREAFLRELGVERILCAPLRLAEEDPHGLVLAFPAPEVEPGREAIAWIVEQAAAVQHRSRQIAQLHGESEQALAEAARHIVILEAEVNRLRERDAAKDNFLANVSHELRSPLVTMLGYTDLLLTEKLGPLVERQRQSLQIARSSGKRLKQFIEELLDFARWELRRGEVALQPMEVRELVARAVEALVPRLHDRRIGVRIDVPPELRALGDRDRLLQVLSNLLVNAEKFCPDGGRIRIRASRHGEEEVAIAVQDNGPGIAPEHQARIFDRLYQVGDDTGASRKGLGLGLNIVKTIVEAHGGTVRVDSAPGRGSTFTFTLPVAPPESAGWKAS